MLDESQAAGPARSPGPARPAWNSWAGTGLAPSRARTYSGSEWRWGTFRGSAWVSGYGGGVTVNRIAERVVAQPGHVTATIGVSNLVQANTVLRSCRSAGSVFSSVTRASVLRRSSKSVWLVIHQCSHPSGLGRGPARPGDRSQPRPPRFLHTKGPPRDRRLGGPSVQYRPEHATIWPCALVAYPSSPRSVLKTTGGANSGWPCHSRRSEAAIARGDGVAHADDPPASRTSDV